METPTRNGWVCPEWAEKNNDTCLPEGGSVASPNISQIRKDLNSKDRN